MVINALNSGAKVFMTDFEDANSPTWENMIEGQRNLSEAIDRTIRLEQGEKVYELNDETATLVVRPRGWHMRRAELRGRRRADVGVAVRLRPLPAAQPRATRSAPAPGRTSTCRSSSRIARRASGTGRSSVRRTTLGIPRGTVRATVLIETVLAAFEMDEILYELGPHATG